MNSSRLAGIPIDHVVAELAAFPFASEAALGIGLTSLDPEVNGDCKKLWRAAELHLIGSFPAFSVDEVVAVRDLVWFAGSSTDSVYLRQYLHGLARWFLEVQGTVAVPRLRQDELGSRSVADAAGPIARERWRWLALAIPPDMLLAALSNRGQGPDRIALLSSILARHLADAGYAETHLHLGAAIDFPILWSAVLRAIATPDLLTGDSFSSPGASLDEGRLLGEWLLRASVARYLLAGFLVYGSWQSGFRSYLEDTAGNTLIPRLGAANWALVLRALDELCRGSLAASTHRKGDYASLCGLYGEVTGVSGRARWLGDRLQAADADPIVPILPRGWGGRGWTAEMRFMTAAFAYLQELEGTKPSRRDPLFERLFWQVVRVRCLFYRHVVQRPMTPGLVWFVRFYGRSSPARRRLSTSLQLESAAVLGGHDHGLRSLEVRASPPTSASELRQLVEQVEQLAEAYRPSGAQSDGWWEPTLEVGIVFHFTKDRGGGAREGRPMAAGRGSHADPFCDPARRLAGNPTGYRFSHFFGEKRREADSLVWLLREFPLSLELVRGVDVCTDELGVPNWVLAPFLKQVRSAGHSAAASLRSRYGFSVPSLATTVHAGEDFVHLLTGLRNLDEAIEGFTLRSGDRIGHGLALGVDTSEWARRAGRLPLSCEERLFDLVWEWSWYGRGGACAEHGRLQFLEHEIAVLSLRVFGSPIPPFELEMLRSDLYNPDSLWAVGFPDGLIAVTASADPRLQLLRRYLTDRAVFNRGRTGIWVDPATEGMILASLQSQLRSKVGALGLTVEVNPTSNLLIGNLGDLTAHPLWRLRPPRPNEDMPPVAVCVGSDDPLVFASGLRQEYQTLCDAMSLAGLTDEECRQWLDRTRATGLQTRFTLSRRCGRRIFDTHRP
jgi:hypothetical protein